MKGRRIPDGSPILAVTLPGDYLLLPDRQAVWCMLPNGVVNRIPCKEAHHERSGEGPVWGLEEHDDGTLTLTPSINLHPGPTHSGWHGFLERGEWREA